MPHGVDELRHPVGDHAQVRAVPRQHRESGEAPDAHEKEVAGRDFSINWSQPASPTLAAMLLPRLIMPLVMAASGSARSALMSPAVIRGRPSEETISACLTPGVAVAKLSSSQPKS